MENKYIGIKSPTTGSSNIGLIFEKQVDNKYHCINWKYYNIPLVLDEEQIKHDLELNYIECYDKK